MDIRYSLYDFFNDSEMEKKRDKYKAAVKAVENDLDNINRSYELVKRSFECVIKNMKGSTTDSEGKIRKDLEEALKAFEERKAKIYKAFDDGIDETEDALKRIRAKYEYYAEQARLEDEEHKTRTEG